MTANDQTSIFEALLEYLRQSRGFDFVGYKRSSLQRRVTKRMQVHQIDNFGDYLEYLKVHPEEFPALFNTILINVTSFFRDLTAWKYLASHTLPQIIKHKSPEEPLRFWTAGCASGEEAYTLAILLVETLGIEDCLRRVKIYATDVDEEALTQARNATYKAKDIESISEEFQQRYFRRVGDRFGLDGDLRRLVIFGRHDLIHDAPISRLDLLICRNTLMYFNAETQKRVLARFHFSLKDTGFVFLGKAEMLLTHSDLFSPLNLQHRIFQKVRKMDRRDRLLVLAQNRTEEAGRRSTLNIRLLEAAFNAIPLAQIIVDSDSNLVLANQLARSRFGIDRQDLGRRFQDLEISYRPVELRSQIERVYKEGNSILVSDVIRTWSDGSVQYLDIEISPLQQNTSAPLGVSITFNEVTRYHQLQEQLERSNQELETVNEELQSSNEELETTNEELQSSHEELETTNEELQSTNEELETMNEELQSSNEELQTINDDLGQKTIELNQCNVFLESIFASLQSAVIVVDRQFQIQTWNEAAQNLWGPKADEVQKQSLFNLDIGLPVERLRDPLYQCLSGTQPGQEILIDALNRQGGSIQCRLSFNPLKDGSKEPHGVILLIKEV
ncbi:CheR family methyltransferase [Oscillatoria acuminata]|uniref:protein-glutamate O-methyltransferase n=1 Tax=Oscillatoria acuminata PCC 6304 TaxID=56110 RepID=K9TP75_9CYAN|nr:CheR family methyltransferase [Oscillatoria acuminata]AFY83961.1 PAS domain S-box [Oscillatoria acuminata PCC 6304]